MENLYDRYSPISSGFFNESYGSYQNIPSDPAAYIPQGHFYSSPDNSWNNPSSNHPQSVSPSEGFSLLNLVDNCYSQAVAEKEQGIKPDYTECPWLKNPEGKRGRPAEYTKEERKWAKWRNNWIYNEKQEMTKSIQRADQLLTHKTNQELKNEYFQLCLEAIVLSENLCPHNQSTVHAAMENPKIEKQICICEGNQSHGRF
uniref:Uncharacterized protein n=1 Tax=Panagrolaimus superbus TaxID=310955 RepID=A0A914Y3L7_9BILA